MGIHQVQCTVCAPGVNFSEHYEDANCQGSIVNRWREDSDCQNVAPETNSDGSVLYESKWCDGDRPIRSLCTEQGVEPVDECGECIEASPHEGMTSAQFCATCVAATCRRVCDEQHGEAAVQDYIDGGCVTR